MHLTSGFASGPDAQFFNDFTSSCSKDQSFRNEIKTNIAQLLLTLSYRGRSGNYSKPSGGKFKHSIQKLVYTGFQLASMDIFR